MRALGFRGFGFRGLGLRFYNSTLANAQCRGRSAQATLSESL